MMNGTLTSSLVQVRKQLGRQRRSAERRLRMLRQFLQVDVKDPFFWWQTWIRYVSRRPIWLTDKFGVTLRLYPYDALRYVRARQSHFDDEGVLKVVGGFLKPGMTVLDVGANIGQFAAFSVGLVGEAGMVHSFEPALDTFNRLNENTQHIKGLAGCIRTNQCAVGKEVGEVTLYEYSPGCSVWNSLSPHTMYSGEQAFEPCRTEKVRMVTLDDYCREQNIQQIDLLKVDVEGFEGDVFQGAARLIREKRIRYAIFEISLGNFKDPKVGAVQVLKVVSSLGLTIQLIREDGSLLPVDIRNFKIPYFANYLAVIA